MKRFKVVDGKPIEVPESHKKRQKSSLAKGVSQFQLAWWRFLVWWNCYTISRKKGCKWCAKQCAWGVAHGGA